MAPIGIVGTGNMGAALWRRLHDCGDAPAVHDVRAQAMAALVAEGATACASPAELAAASDIVLISLPTSADVADAALGASGIVHGARAGTLVVDTTSGAPAESRRIAAALAASGLRYIDAGVSGGVEGARNGALKVMVGGETADVDAARSLLGHIGAQVWHCGAVGSGHTVKTLLNMSNQTKLMVEIEALLVAAREGVDPRLVADVLDLAVWRQWLFGPSGRKPFGFTLALACKDFDIALRLAAEAGVAVPIASVAQQVARLALSAAGDGADLIDGVAVWEALAKTRLGHASQEEAP